MMARWFETLQEFDITIQHRPGRQHSNVDGMSRPFCKQCWGKTSKRPWVDQVIEGAELECADEIAELLGINTKENTLYFTVESANDSPTPTVGRVTFLSQFSDAQISELQLQDSDLGPVVQWLKNGETSAFDDLRSYSLATRKIWNLVPMVHRVQDVLVFKPDETATLKLVVPYVLWRQLFDASHSGLLAAHLGSFCMTEELKLNYFWPNLRKDIECWCKQCPTCAKGRGTPPRRHGRLQKVMTGAPLDIVAVDILSGLPTTPEGYKYILVLTDYFTKWSEEYPLMDAEASTCVRVMYDSFFARFGLPCQLHSDMGKNFESNLFKELCQLVGTYKSHTSPFHAQSDGQCERINRSLLQMLRATAQENPQSWPQCLPTLMAAYRMTTHKVTGMTPNFAMFAREVILPPNLIAKPP